MGRLRASLWALLFAVLFFDIHAASAQTTLSPTSLSFSSTALGNTSSSKNVTLKNTQTVPLTSIAASTSSDYAVQATTCGSSLAPGASCTFSVVFAPIATGTRNGTLTITHSASNSPQTVALSGTGVLPVLLTPTSLSFTATAVGSSSTAQSVTVKNNQSTPLTSLIVSISGDYTQTNNCAATLNPGASCKVNVTFTPAAGGARNGMLAFSDSAVTSPQTVALVGTGTGVTIGISPTGLAFGSQLVNSTSAPQNVAVTNTGSLAVTISSITISGEFAQSNNCPATLASGSSCAVAVVFAPQSAGAKSGTLTISDNASGAPHSVWLSGTGDTRTVSVTPGTLAFGNQLQKTTSTAQNVTLTNTGTLAVTISGVTIGGEFTQSNNCPATLTPSSSCVVAVTFAPQSTGAKSATLTINDNGGGPHTVSLSGTGTSLTASATPASLSFGDQLQNTTSTAQNVTLTNTGTLGVTISGVTISGEFTQSNNCPATLASGSSCAVAVLFAPQSAGTKSGTLTINDNGGGPHTVSLSGNGTSLNASATPGSLSFGDQLQNTTSTAQNVTLTNTGTLGVTISGIAISGEFTQSNNCPATLNPSSSCVVAVTFAPQSTGAKSATLTINDNGGGPHTVALSGNGTSLTASATPGSLSFGDQLQNTTSTAQSVTFTNTGTLAVTVSGVTISGEFTQSNNCPAMLNPSSSCVVAVTFAPQSTGAKSGTLAINDNGGGPHSISLSGNATSLTASATPGSLSFGDQLQNTTSTAQNITLTNTGTLGVTISGVTISGEFTQRNNCPATLPAAGSCNIAVTFAPLSSGAKSGTLTISDNATAGPQTLALSGNGTSKTVALSSSSLVFGDQVVGTGSAWQSVVVTNTGTLNVYISGVVVSGEFRQSTNCAMIILTPGASCGVSLSFAPTSAGAKPGTLTVSDDATGSPQIVSLSGSALAVALSSVRVLPANAYLLTNGMQTFVAVGLYNDGSTQDLTASTTWTSSDPAVVTMAGSVATAVASGTATITAQSGGTTLTATVTVTDTGSGSVGNMQFARTGHQAVTLQDGTVLILGGQDASGTMVAAAELFDPATRQFRPTGSMVTPRQSFSATRLQDGRVLVTGGGTSAAEIYDPADGLFHPTGDTSVAGTATLLNDGRVLLTGAYYNGYQWSGIAELYDPQSGTFSAVGPMVGARSEHSSTLLQDGRVLIVGGDQTTQDGTAEIFDPATMTFTPTGSIPVNRFAHTASLPQDGRVLIAGGYGAELLPTASFIYDPATGTFSQTGSLATSRYNHNATVLNDGRVLIAAGFAWWFSTGSVEIFDPATGAFTISRELQSRRAFSPAAMLATGDILFTGGDTRSDDPALPGGPTASAELYNNPAPLTSMQVTPANPQLPAGQSVFFGLVGTFSDGTIQPLTGLAEWTSSDTNVVSIDAHLGYATANASGTATGSAQLGSFSAATTITVP